MTQKISENFQFANLSSCEYLNFIWPAKYAKPVSLTPSSNWFMINFSPTRFVPNNESIFAKLFFRNFSFVIQPSTVQIEFDVFKKDLLTIKFNLSHLHLVFIAKSAQCEIKLLLRRWRQNQKLFSTAWKYLLKIKS